MKRIVCMQTLIPLGILSLLSCVAWATQNGVQLTMDGRVLSKDIQLIRGRPYVPLSDVAQMLTRKVVKQGRGYHFTQVTRAEQLRGRSGKMAANLFSGTWRFQVASVQQVPAYTPLYGLEKASLTPKEAGDALMLVTCHLRNDALEMQEVSFDTHSSGNTALHDAQEHGYVPVAYDMRGSDYSSVKIPAGTMLDFVMIFSVPKGANLTQLTYAVGGMDVEKRSQFRVALQPGR